MNAGIRGEQRAHGGVGVGALQLDAVAVAVGRRRRRADRPGAEVDIGERRPDGAAPTLP